jgi:hypothetical protein
MFKCEYYNQPFGEAEEIAGYRGLKVDVWVCSRTFQTWCAGGGGGGERQGGRGGWRVIDGAGPHRAKQSCR